MKTTKSDLLEKIKALLRRMQDHETPDDLTGKNALGPLLKDAEELVETVSVLKYVIEKEEESEALPEKPIAPARPEPPPETPHGSGSTVNERIAPAKGQKRVADKLGGELISDLKSAIGLNERFLFVNELFDKDYSAFQAALNTLNDFANLDEALSFVRNLSEKYQWDQEHESAVSFYALVEKRYAE